MICILRGGGDLGTGVALRLYRAGIKVVICELEHPLVVRRTVSFAEAMRLGSIEIEGVESRASNFADVWRFLGDGIIPVLNDPSGQIIHRIKPNIVVDARMLKHVPEYSTQIAPFVIGLGPGFEAGLNCHAVIETKRGHTLGRVIWNGSAEPDSKEPESVNGHSSSRVLRATNSGIVAELVKIGDIVKKAQPLLRIENTTVSAPFDGVVRGLIASGTYVVNDMKVGDVDPRLDPSMCNIVSDKAYSIGGGVMEAIFSQPFLRREYCQDLSI